MSETTYLSVSQVARRLSVNKRTVYRWLDAGKLPGAIQIPGRSPTKREWRIPEEALKALEVKPAEAYLLTRTCEGTKKNGGSCGQPALKGSRFCRLHQEQADSSAQAE